MSRYCYCRSILLSRFVSRSGRETAEDATQIFGGRGITVGGMGKVIENVCLLDLLIRDPLFYARHSCSL